MLYWIIDLTTILKISDQGLDINWNELIDGSLDRYTLTNPRKLMGAVLLIWFLKMWF